MQYKFALELVADLFRDVNRTLSGLPYVVHLVGVSYMVGKVTDDEDVIIAALLHDVLEDIPADVYSEPQMRAQFGDKITDIVKTVSHDDSTYGKKESRERYLKQINEGTTEACIVSAADLLHNATDIVYLYGRNPSIVQSKFGGERAKFRVWFWGERYRILKSRLGNDNKIIQELDTVMPKLDKVHSEIM